MFSNGVLLQMETTLPSSMLPYLVASFWYSFVFVHYSISDVFIVVILSSYQLWDIFPSYQHVTKRLLYKWATCDSAIVDNTNLDKMALRGASEAVKSGIWDIQTIRVMYSARTIYENQRWNGYKFYPSPDISLRYVNSPPFLKPEDSLRVEFSSHCFWINDWIYHFYYAWRCSNIWKRR